MLMKRVFLALTFGIILCDAASDEFIIQKKSHEKKLSANALKEQIGQTTKKTFQCANAIIHQTGKMQCTLATLHQSSLDANDKKSDANNLAQVNVHSWRVFGLMQQKLSLIQNKCSSVVEKLIDNEEPFKKISKKSLEQASRLLANSHQSIQDISSAVIALHADLEKACACQPSSIVPVKNVTKKLEAHVHTLDTMYNALHADACLGKC